jgi:hypothetical protein
MDGGTKYHGMGWACESNETEKTENNATSIVLSFDDVLTGEQAAESMVQDMIKLCPFN